jgi:hypothetical protein
LNIRKLFRINIFDGVTAWGGERKQQEGRMPENGVGQGTPTGEGAGQQQAPRLARMIFLDGTDRADGALHLFTFS